MRRCFEYGALSAAILTFVYLLIAFLSDVVLNFQVIGICLAGGVLTGLFISIAFYVFSPGEAILEGEEDNYIN